MKLSVLRKFYENLYSLQDIVTEEDIKVFFSNIPDIPKITFEAVDGGPIIEQEIHSTIGKLCVGKAPGYQDVMG